MRTRNPFFYALLFLFLIPVFLSGQSIERDNLSRVRVALNEISIPFEERHHLDGYGGFGSSLLVRKTALDESRGTFVLAVPLDAEFAVDAALALAKKTGDDNSSVNILIAFLGDEKNELPAELGGISHIGLRDLLTLAEMPENWVLCYLDANVPSGGLVISHGSREYVAPLDVVKPLPGLFDSRNIPWSFEIRYNELYKLGLVEGPEALSIICGEEINGFVLSGGGEAGTPGETSISGENVTPEKLADLFLDYTVLLNLPILEADRHYSFFPFFTGGVFFVTEGFTTVLLLVTAGVLLFLFLLYSARHSVILVFYIRLFFKFIWIFFIFLPLLVLSIKVSGFFYSFLLSVFDVPREGTNHAGVVLTVLLASLIFFLPSPALNLFHFPRRAQFYGISAVIFVTAGMFLAAFLDFSYVPVFLWAFCFVFLGALITKPKLIFLCCLMIPIFALGALFNIFEAGNEKITESILSSDWNTPGNWRAAFQIALISLPFFLIAKRGIILRKKPARRIREPKPSRKSRLIIVPALIVLVSGIMVIQILLVPRRQFSPERRFISEDAKPEKREDGVLSVSLEDNIFQDSRIITLRIGARGNPVRFDVSFASGNGQSLLPIYSAPVPFERADNGRKIHFVLGEQAPNPITLEIVVPLKFEGLLETEAVYNTWDPAIDPGEKPGSNDYILRVSKSIDLGLEPASTSGIQP